MTGESTAGERDWYEIPPLDRSGLLFGFGFGELLVVGVVGAACFGLIQGGVPPLVYSPILLGAIWLVRRPWPGGLQLLEYWPILSHRLATLRTGGQWRASQRWTGGPAGDLPPSLGGIELATVAPAGWGEVGVVVDRAAAAATFVVELGSSSFLLEPVADQRALLDRWGRIIGASVLAGHSEVRHVSFTLISSQGSPKDHLRFVDQAAGEVTATRVAADYTRLVCQGAASTTSHRILFSVTVGARKPTRTAGWGLDRDDRTDQQAEPAPPGGGRVAGRGQHLEQVARTVTSSLHQLGSLGWPEQRPLGRGEVLELFGECVDPGTRLGRAAQADRSLAAMVGLGSVAGPPSVVAGQREYVSINGVAHRTYWVRTWPNYGLGPDWMIRFLAEVAGERRFTVFFRPVPRTESVRAYERDMARHDSSVIVAAEKGKRVPLSSRRAQQSVAELGEDLMAGYPEVELCALATVSGANPQILRRRCDAFESLAVSHGVQLTALRDAHELGWAHSTPFGLCPIKPRTPWS
jgi:hypothetical protein